MEKINNFSEFFVFWTLFDNVHNFPLWNRIHTPVLDIGNTLLHIPDKKNPYIDICASYSVNNSHTNVFHNMNTFPRIFFHRLPYRTKNIVHHKRDHHQNKLLVNIVHIFLNGFCKLRIHMFHKVIQQCIHNIKKSFVALHHQRLRAPGCELAAKVRATLAVSHAE